MSARSEYLISFLKYCATGLASAGADLGSYVLFIQLGAHPLIANLISRSLGGSVCFVINKYWTFESRRVAHLANELTRFWTVFGVSFVLSELLLGAFYELFGLGALISKILTEGILLFVNFLSLRHWAFRRARVERREKDAR